VTPPMQPVSSLRISSPVINEPSLASHDEAPQVMAQFQQTMARFLDTQKAIMLSYLSLEPMAAPSAVSLEAATPVLSPQLSTDIRPAEPDAWAEAPGASEHAFAAAASTSASAAVHSVSTPPAASPSSVADSSAPSLPGIDVKELATRLLTIVSERTG